VPRFVWTTGGETIGRHDLVDSRHAHRSLRPHVPGDFVVVPDPARPDDTDAGWLVGFVHDLSGNTTDLRVIDAAAIAELAVATVRIPRPIARELRCTWIPSSQH
jgi:carotenoid cleavage dioxygenase-like enzyme